MRISWSFSTQEQAERLPQLLSILLESEPDGNSWKCKRIAMYPSFDELGLFYVILLKLVDKSDQPLYISIARNGLYTFVHNLNWEEENV
jgi:hypothetical protein